MKIQIIKTESGEDLAVLPRADLERLRDLADDRLDAEAAKKILDRIASGEEELVPAAVTNRLLGGESPVKVWREHRKLTQAELAGKAGLSTSYLSQIEAGQRGGSTTVLQMIARALHVDLEDVVTVSDLMHAAPLALQDFEFPFYSTDAWSADWSHLYWPATGIDGNLIRIWIDVESLSEFSGIPFGVDSKKARMALEVNRDTIELLAQRNYQPGVVDVFVEKADFALAKNRML